MSEATIRSRINTVLGDVVDIGVTHDYERWSSTWDAYLAQFKTTIGSTPQIRGAEILYRGFTQDLSTLSTCSVVRYHNFVVVFIMGLNDGDATEKVAAPLVEAIVAALDKDAALNGASYVGFNPSQVETFEPRMFGDVLCHYAEIRKIVAEDFTWAS